jgi:hypothetical protein
MRKILIFALLAAFIAPMFADDAKVLPAGVIRPTFAYIYNTYDESYDTDGELSDVDKVAMNMLGAALEFGVTESITLAAQWVPGYTFLSETEQTGYEKLNLNGFSDLFLGAKAQILGNQGFLKNDTMRFSLALGAVIPLNAYDAADEYENYASGDDFTFKSISNDAFGLGFRAYYDIIITPDFYVNFYAQYVHYFETEKESTVLQTIMNGGSAITYDYGSTFSLDFEIEPNYTFKFNEGNKLSIGVPFAFAYTPEYDVDGVTQDDSDTMLFSVAPALNFFTTALYIPMDFKVQYSIPLYGENAYASNTLIVQLKLYAKLY